MTIVLTVAGGRDTVAAAVGTPHRRPEGAPPPRQGGPTAAAAAAAPAAGGGLSGERSAARVACRQERACGGVGWTGV